MGGGEVKGELGESEGKGERGRNRKEERIVF